MLRAFNWVGESIDSPANTFALQISTSEVFSIPSGDGISVIAAAVDTSIHIVAFDTDNV